jgi:hypothetical protein
MGEAIAGRPVAALRAGPCLRDSRYLLRVGSRWCDPTSRLSGHHAPRGRRGSAIRSLHRDARPHLLRTSVGVVGLHTLVANDGDDHLRCKLSRRAIVGDGRDAVASKSPLNSLPQLREAGCLPADILFAPALVKASLRELGERRKLKRSGFNSSQRSSGNIHSGRRGVCSGREEAARAVRAVDTMVVRLLIFEGDKPLRNGPAGGLVFHLKSLRQFQSVESVKFTRRGSPAPTNPRRAPWRKFFREEKFVPAATFIGHGKRKCPLNGYNDGGLG